MSDTENYDANEVAEHLRDHALFTGFAPVNHPQVLVSTILEHGGWGRNAAPIARKIMDYVLVKPTLHPEAQKQEGDDKSATPVDVSKTTAVKTS